jgi:hypothetical protein
VGERDDDGDGKGYGYDKGKDILSPRILLDIRSAREENAH